MLELSENHLSEISSDTFAGLTSLQKMWLNNNRLSEIPPSTFSKLTTLEELNLSENQISKVPPNIFSGLTYLEELNLSENHLSEIPPGIFLGLASLQRLWLDNNNLSEIPPGTFVGLTSLEVLGLDYNHLSEIPLGIHDKCSINFTPQRLKVIKEHKHLPEEGVMCSISYDPIGGGCEYRACSNPIKQHYVLSEHWNEWEKTCGNSKCVMCKEYDVVPKIFINN
jgi:Leucine-rich repeat (LRR) protein